MEKREQISTSEYTYTAVFQPEPEGGYTVTVPALQGCVSYGETLEEAREMAADAITGYLESLQKDSLPVPPSEEQATEARREPVTVKL